MTKQKEFEEIIASVEIIGLIGKQQIYLIEIANLALNAKNKDKRIDWWVLYAGKEREINKIKLNAEMNIKEHKTRRCPKCKKELFLPSTGRLAGICFECREEYMILTDGTIINVNSESQE